MMEHETGILEIDISELLPATELQARGRGKPPKELTAAISRHLDQEDIETSNEVAAYTTEPGGTPPLQRLRQRHHQLAQLLAKGYSDVEVSRMMNYSQTRISILKKDPAFANLISNYSEMVDEIFTDTVENMKILTDDAIDELHERLELDPGGFTNGQLIEVVKTVGDRAGFSPVQKTIQANIPMDDRTLEMLKGKAKEAQNGQVIKAAQTIEAVYTEVPNDPGITVGEDEIKTPAAVSKTCEIKRFPGAGQNIREESGEGAQTSDSET